MVTLTFIPFQSTIVFPDWVEITPCEQRTISHLIPSDHGMMRKLGIIRGNVEMEIVKYKPTGKLFSKPTEWPINSKYYVAL